MDELRGPQIQLILHVKEGIGFGFIKSPFVVSGSLNGYMLETDPVVPCHAPAFDAELVWEADKRRFRSLRVQNVPVKVEVYTMGTQGRKDKVGYLLISLLGAQPCPTNKFVDVKHTWHRLLGVKSEGKCCHPQLMLSLTIQDRNSTPTPRNELRLFHNTERVPNPAMPVENPPVAKNSLPTLEEYMAESKKLPKSAELHPKLICDEGLIQIGSGKDIFILSFVIGTVENIDMLLPVSEPFADKEMECHVTYSVFNHDITTDRVRVEVDSTGNVGRAALNQRSSVRCASTLHTLAKYFSECRLIATIHVAGCKGMFSVDLRKLIPTESLHHFIRDFCNNDKAIVIQERCFIVPSERTINIASRRPYVDVELSLKYANDSQGFFPKPTVLSARSATHLNTDRNIEQIGVDTILQYTSGSCTNLQQENIGTGYTNMTAGNPGRYKNASGDTIFQTNEIADLIRKMYESFTLNQEKILAIRDRPITCDMQVQCETTQCEKEVEINEQLMNNETEEANKDTIRSPKKQQSTKCEYCAKENDRDVINLAIPKEERDTLMKRFVEELEDWKEKQQELFKCQLKRKEEYHLDLLSKEWERKRSELECKLSSGIGQCRHLAEELSRATDELRLRGFRNIEREKKLQEAKKSLEEHYTSKYQQLREASQSMEADMNHQIKVKDLRVEELEMKIQQLERQNEVLKNNLKNNEKEAENKYSGLTKDQTASLIQELRCLEEKLDAAVQSKSFFKEQWARAVRELHTSKLRARTSMLAQLTHDRRQLADLTLEPIPDQEEPTLLEPVDMKKLKDDFYVDLLANTPGLNESHSIISTSGLDGMELYDEMISIPKNPLNEKLNDLTAKRDKLVQQESPDEEVLKQLNQEIRSLLLNCGA